MKSDIFSKIFIYVTCLSAIAVILSTGNKFLWNKDYNFIVEASCDPESTICYQRDCLSSECPPNQYDSYRTFNIRAADFEKCKDNSCLQECEMGLIDCEEMVCDEIYDSCSGSLAGLVSEKIDLGSNESLPDATPVDPVRGSIIN